MTTTSKDDPSNKWLSTKSKIKVFELESLIASMLAWCDWNKLRIRIIPPTDIITTVIPNSVNKTKATRFYIFYLFSRLKNWFKIILPNHLYTGHYKKTFSCNIDITNWIYFQNFKIYSNGEFCILEVLKRKIPKLSFALPQTFRLSRFLDQSRSILTKNSILFKAKLQNHKNEI